MNLKFLQFKYKNKDQGFVLLFAVVLSAIIFAITLGMTNIALKEITFATSAKNSNDAFFAADTGAECALYHDLVGAQSLFGQVPAYGTVIGEITTLCAGSAVNLNDQDPFDNSVPSTPQDPPWTFILRPLGTSGTACAVVTVDKVANLENNTIDTTIISRGYNIGDELCESNNPQRVERVLELRY